MRKQAGARGAVDDSADIGDIGAGRPDTDTDAGPSTYNSCLCWW